MRTIRKLSLAALTVSLTLDLPGAALAQTATADPGANAAAPTSAPTQAEKRKQTRAQRKAARAKNAAELKKLEANGYQPSANDPNYPQDLQNAERRAAGGASSRP